MAPSPLVARPKEIPRQKKEAQGGALARTLELALGWAVLVAAGPGILAPDGFGWLAALGIALWADAVRRPARGALLCEILLAGAAWSVITSWAAYVLPASLLWLGLGYGLYFAAAGGILRRLARHVPLGLAAPAAWVSIETLIAILPPPFGQPWMRLGVHLHDSPWIAGSARVWGVVGLSWVLAGAGGGLAEAWRRGGLGRAALRGAATGFVPTALGALLALAVPAPECEDGPRVLLVQPAVPQSRKMEGTDPVALLRDAVDLTREGLAALEAAGEPGPDLVVWGETMLPLLLMGPGTAEAVDAGQRFEAWSPLTLDPGAVQAWLDAEDHWVRGILLGRGAGNVLPPRTAFAAGVEMAVPHGGVLRRQNVLQLWEADGTRGSHVAKLHLAPGGETLLGLERLGWVRSSILALASYVPDLLPGEKAGAVTFRDRGGRLRRVGVAICYDNPFDEPFLDPLLEAPLDFTLVVSNEAWFESSCELDQMVAFSRLAAQASGRAVVRATNSGVTCVLAPDGREVARLRRDGRDREVRGTLHATVPVPLDAGWVPPVARWRRALSLLALALPILLALAPLRRGPPGERRVPR